MLDVTVIGSAILDLVIASGRVIPRSGETILGRTLTRHLGGKGANQAVAASRVTDHVEFYASVGGDESGSYLQEQLRLSGLGNARILISESAPTGMAFIIVDDAGNNSIVVVPGANHHWPVDAADCLTQPTICISQFEIPLETTRRFFARNRELGGRNILNPSPLRKNLKRSAFSNRLPCPQ